MAAPAFRLLLFIVLGLLPLGLRAEEGYWLIEHATVVAGDPASPEIIEDCRLLLRHGIIRQLGREIETPSDLHLARRLDAKGLWAYPAFIDALTGAGVGPRTPPQDNEDAPPDFESGALARSREAQRTGIFPERSVLELWKPEEALLDRFRRQGFAALHLWEERGFLPGRSALVSLRGGPLRSAVIAAEVAQPARFSFSAPGYPSSLMGAIAYLRQTFLDAIHHRDCLSLYERQRRGVPRPPRDTALEALAPLLERSRPLFLEAVSENEIWRARRFAEEFGLELVIAGGTAAYKLAGRLERGGTRVVLLPDLGEPPAPRPGEPALPARVEEDRLERWKADAGGAAVLRAKGIPFAFGSGSRADPERLLKNVRFSIEHGLEEKEALRAMTLGTAELLGVADVLGSLEPGKSANLALRAPAVEKAGFGLAPESRLRYLFIDGVLFEYGAPPAAAARQGAERRAEEDPAAPPSARRRRAGTDPEARRPSGSVPEGEPGAAPPEGDAPREAETPAAAPGYRTELEADRRPRLVTGGNLLIRNATVLTCAGRDLERGDILIRGGRIAALSPDLEAKEGIAELDASGWFVMPGIVDCHSHIAIDGGVNESSQSITAEVRIRDVLNPGHLALYRALAGGVTTSNLLHGSANTIGGQNCVIRNRYGAAPEDLPFPGAPAGVKLALGENPRRSNVSGRSGRFPQSRMGVEAVIRRAFAEAADYRRRMAEHGARLAAGERLAAPRRDLRLEALLEILEGRRVIHAHCYRADEILMLLGVAEELGLKLATLQHVLEGYKVAPEIAALGAGASTFSDWWAYKVEAFDAIPHNAALMTRAGVLVSINSDDPEMVRRLNQEAAKSMRSGGLSAEEALRLITRNPAAQLGILERTGTIEVGKDADLAIFDAHPLSVYARCRYTLIAGEVFFERRMPDQPEAGRRALLSAGSAPVPAFAPATQLAAAPVPRNPRRLYALRGGRVFPVAAAPIEEGTIIIDSGRIAAVGPMDEVSVPAGATVLDVAGLGVYPGFIDAGTRLGLTEITSVPGTVDSREIGSVQPDLLAATAVNAHSELIPVARGGGVTAAAVFASGPLIAGQAAVIRLDGSTTREMVLRRRLGLQVALPLARSDAAAAPQVKMLEEWIERARAYEAQIRAAETGGGPRPPKEPRLEALIPYARGELPVIFAANGEAQIRLAATVAERLKLRPIVRGGRDAWKVAGLLREKGIPVIVGPVNALPLESHDPYDAPYANPGELFRAGVPFAFQTDHAALSSNLPYHAGTAVAFGLPYEEALKALTLGAARILGVEEEIGSLEPGKLADIIVVDGDPLEPSSRLIHLFLAGEPAALECRHTRLHDQFRERCEPPARWRF
jgi:imidazolonepropionase-like amidohydrolase